MQFRCSDQGKLWGAQGRVRGGKPRERGESHDDFSRGRGTKRRKEFVWASDHILAEMTHLPKVHKQPSILRTSQQ